MKTSFSTEFFYLMVNRFANPLMAFVALGFFTRTSTPENVSKYLLAYTACQWAITSCFQWQKNVYVKTYADVSEKSSLFVFMTSIIIFVPCFLFINMNDGFKYALSLVLMCCSVGLIYYLGIAVRMRGGDKLYLIGDSLSTVTRWGIAIILSSYYFSLDLFYYFIFIFSIPLILFYIKWLLVSVKSSEKTDSFFLKFSFSDVSKIFYLSVFYIVIDFSSSGINYLDRFYINDLEKDSYLIHAAIGTQISSIFFGALISAINPRLKFVDGTKYSALLRGAELKMLLLLVFVTVFSFFCSPYIMELLTGVEGDPILLTLFSLTQFLHFYVMLIFVFSVHYNSDVKISFFYLFGFLLFWIVIYYFKYSSAYQFLFLKIVILAGMCVLSSYRVRKSINVI